MGGVINAANGAVHSLTGIDVTGGYAAQQGLQAQQQAANNANDTQWAIYNQTRSDQAPWRQAGANAVGQLSNNMGYYNQPFTMNDFHQDPGYQFNLQQGQQAIQRSAGVNGGLVSGGQLAALNNYSQGMASNEYQNAYNRFQNDRTQSFNRLSTLAGLGQTATQATGAAGANYANQYGQNVTGAANAQAAYGQQQQGMTMGMLGIGAGLYAGSKGWL